MLGEQDETQQVNPPGAERVDSGTTDPSAPRIDGSAPHQAPARLGSYEIEDVLGSGGSGVVYRAFDPRLQRAVAVKLLRADPGGDDRRARAGAERRLLREAQALAHLKHPNVVTVHDVGFYDQDDLGTKLDASAKGLFVVMELVEGQNLGEWCRQKQRTWTEVVDVMLPAARGLAAAHEAGVLHRDFKPANVAVGADGHVRVLDFGLARLNPEEEARSDGGSSDRARPSTSGPPLTQHGTIMGTPAYMAPEQHAGAVADERTDIYGYCATLWETLTGKRPFRGSNKEIARAKFRGPPAFPEGHSVPAWLVQIVRRGLGTKPDARWPSMAAVVAALERGLKRRQRLLMAGVAIPLVAFAAVVGGQRYAHTRAIAACDETRTELDGVWDPSRRDSARQAVLATDLPYADASWQATASALDGYADSWGEARRRVCVTKLDAPSSSDAPRLCLERRRAELGALIDLLADADPSIARTAVAVASGLRSPHRCLQEGDTAKAATASPEQSRTSGRVLARVKILRQSGRADYARTLLEPLLPELGRIGDPSLLAEAHYEHGRVLTSAGERKEAEAAYRASLMASELAGSDRTRMMALGSLSSLLAGYDSRYREATALLDQAEAVSGRIGGEPAAEAWHQELRGLLATYQGDFEAASVAFARQLEILEAQQPSRPLALAGALHNVGRNFVDRGDPDSAIEAHQRALALQSALLGPEHPRNAHLLSSLGVAHERKGMIKREIEYYSRALAVLEADGGRKSKIAMVSGNLAQALDRVGATQEAEQRMGRALDLAEEVYGPDHPTYGRYLIGYAVLVGDRRHDDAAAALRRSLEIWQDKAPDNPDASEAWSALGDLEFTAGRHDEAMAHYERGLALLASTAGRDNHAMGPLLVAGQAQVHIARGDSSGAIPLLQEALAISEQQGVTTGSELESMHRDLATLLEQTDPAQAAQHSEAADRIRRESDRLFGD